MNLKRHFFRLTLWALACGLMAGVQAQSAWPSKPLRIVVPFAPGSFTDLSARALAVELTEQLGQQVVVENKGGAGGTIGADAVAKSAPDGHTLLLTDNSFVMAAGLYPRLPFDPQKDFAQISAIAESPSIMIARADLPAKSVAQLVDAARAKPMDFMFGSGGQGSSAHLATELFLSVTGTKMTHVPRSNKGQVCPVFHKRTRLPKVSQVTCSKAVCNPKRYKTPTALGPS